MPGSPEIFPLQSTSVLHRILIFLIIHGKRFLSTFLVRNRKFRGEFLNGSLAGLGYPLGVLRWFCFSENRFIFFKKILIVKSSYDFRSALRGYFRSTPGVSGEAGACLGTGGFCRSGVTTVAIE